MQFGVTVDAMNGKLIAALFIGLGLFALASAAAQQSRVEREQGITQKAATDQPVPSKEDWKTENSMEEWLLENGKTAERLVALGVNLETANAFISDENSTPLYAKWKSLHLGAKLRTAALFLPCSQPFDRAYLYLLQWSGAAWHATDHDELDCHYDESVSMEVVEIRDPSRDEVMIHHACGGHGTGYLEQDFSVLLPVQGKFKEELETEEILRSSPAGKERRDLDRKSTFTIIPLSHRRSRAIEQTRSSILNGRLIVQRRVFRWDPAKGRYRPSAFTPVEAAPTN